MNQPIRDDAGNEAYFRDFVLRACGEITDRGALILMFQGQLVEWERREGADAQERAAMLRLALQRIEERARASLAVLQSEIDATPRLVDMGRAAEAFS